MQQLGGGNIASHTLPSAPTATPGFWKTVFDTVDDIIQSFADGLNGLSGIIRGIPQTDPVCFVGGTLVRMEFGEIPIEEIRAGDLVWSWDEETGNTVLKEVVETYINETDKLVHVFVNGNEIIATPSHPFYSPVKGWTEAAQLRAGDMLVLVNDEYVVVEKVQHEILESPITVFNFQVQDYHTYYVSNIGILVHNSCVKPIAPKEVGKRYIDTNSIDAHAFKQKAGQIPRSQISRYDIYQDTADNHRLWVGKKDGRDWRQTNYVFSDLNEKWVK